MANSILDDYELDIDEEDIEIISEPVVTGRRTLPDMGISHIISTPDVPRHTVLDLQNIDSCPRCHKPLVPAIAIDGDASLSWMECPDCGTLVNRYTPTPYQAEFLRRPERYKMTAGGFGSGKTRVDVEDVIKHLLLIPGSRVGVAANTYPQLQGTFIKEFNNIMPAKLLKRKNDQKHEYEFTNGSEMIYRSFDDPSKLKSLNLSKIVLVEADGIPYSGFTMMQTRLRNTAALIPEYDPQTNLPLKVWSEKHKAYRIQYRVDARSINLETNPSSGWVKTKFLQDSHVVDYYGEAYNEGYKFSKTPDPNKYTQIVSTSANPHLPETYEEEQTRGKPEAYVQQMFKGSFNFGTGLVFPNFGLTIVPPHPLPREFNEEGRRVLFYVLGADYGIVDHTHFMYGAYSTETKKLYWFAEMRINESDIKRIAQTHRKSYKVNGWKPKGLMMMPRFDGRTWNKRESDLRTIGSMFEDEGLYFEPSFASHEARIIKMNSLINHGQMETFSTCEFFIEEMLNYKWKLDKNGEPTSTPVDGNDHGITAAEFVIVELPNDLNAVDMKVYLPPGVHHVHDKQPIADPAAPAVWAPLKVKEKSHANNRPGYGHNLNYHGVNRGPVVAHARSIYDDDEDTEADQRENQRLTSYLPRR